MIIRLHIRLLLATTFALLGLAMGTAHAQDPAPKTDSTDEFDLSNIPVDEGRAPGYGGLGGGYQGMLAFMNFDGLNTLTGRMGVGQFSGQLFLHGGGGSVVVGYIKNLRVGIYGEGGSKEVSKDLTIAGQALKRTVRFSTGQITLNVDYAITALRPLFIFPGVGFGAGSKTVEVIQSATGNTPFNSMFDSTAFNGNGSGNNRMARIVNSPLIFNPYVNLEFAPSNFVSLRAGIGYSGSLLGDKWYDDVNATSTITNVPAISADGLRLQFGILIGFFGN